MERLVSSVCRDKEGFVLKMQLLLRSVKGGGCGQHHAPAAFTPGKDPAPIVQEAGWAPEPVWIGAENLAPPGFDPRTFQPIESLYRLSYPGFSDRT
jgi:hypothetical protein